MFHPPSVYCPRRAKSARNGNSHKFCTDHDLGFFFQFCEYCVYGNNKKTHKKLLYNQWRGEQ